MLISKATIPSAGCPRRYRWGFTLDIARARTLLKWEPRVARAEGLEKTVAYFRSLRG